ncbi:MAG TPA: hypothetical protein VGX00_08850 [Thermoplasmata archaeon]|nr:hypothetical protein [Thermoplasmata archaeon]
MIRATARVLKNIIEIEVGSETWIARPVPSMTAPIARQISSLFSTVYETFRPADSGGIHSTVSYHAKKDEIMVQLGETKWRTRSSAFGPLTFEYGNLPYEIHEKLTGRFAIFQASTMVATGQLGFRSCAMGEYPADLEPFLANLALGYLVRTLFWEMFR